jgi:hypothetical protein
LYRRTFEVGDRPDSVIPFDVVRLVVHGASPFSAHGRSLFAPWHFSDRGPLSGVAAAPVVLLAGGRPPRAPSNAAWVPFDAQGFMAYRLAMMVFASTAFLAVWTVVRRLADVRTARFALMLAVTTPFLVHEIWFTWPKLLASGLVLLAAVLLLDGRGLRAGALTGAAYLVHPLALLSVPVLVLLALWPLEGARLRRPRLRPALMVLGGVAAAYGGWRLVNGSRYTQAAFLDYFKQAGRSRYLEGVELRLTGRAVPPVSPADWLGSRVESVANTLVPLCLFVFSRHDPSINAVNSSCYPFCARGTSAPVVPFFFQYWTTVPFGLGIAFFPLLLLSVWRAMRRWPWAVTAVVLVPFAFFAVYWGDATTGMLREGLHVWVFSLLIVVALQQAHARFPWLRDARLRALLALRAAEVLAFATIPTLMTRHRLIDAGHALTDTIALLTMAGACGWLGAMMWRERAVGEAARSASPRSPPHDDRATAR